MIMSALLLSLAVQDAGVVTGDAPAAKERKICRTVGGTGSRLRGYRDCRTAAQWRVKDAEELQGSLNGMTTDDVTRGRTGPRG